MKLGENQLETIKKYPTEILVKELESRNMRVYDKPQDALNDISRDDLVDKVRDLDYLVYSDRYDVLNDFNDDDLIEAIENSGYKCVDANQIVGENIMGLLEEYHQKLSLNKKEEADIIMSEILWQALGRIV